MRDSYDDFQYEDELDRMRDRKNRKTTKRPATASRAYHEEEEDDSWEEIDIYQDKEKSRRNTVKTSSNTSKNIVKKKNRKGRFFVPILLILILVVGGMAFSFWRNANKGYWTVAVFGVDSRDGGLGKGTLSDVEIICTVNRETGEIKLLSVFRDTYLKIDKDGNYHKVNEAYFKGGPTQGIYALEENLDLKIDDYATFNWKAVADTINILGGIDLEITDREFAYINSFITETAETTGIGSVHLKQSGMNHLDGVQAVAYARLRLMDTDFKRTERQRKVIGLAMEKAKQADISVLNNIVVTVTPQLSTSVNAADMIALAMNIDKYYIGETSGFPFAHEQARISGRDCVIPATLESNVIQLHQFLYGIEDYKPSQTVKTINNKIIQDSGVGQVGQDTESGKNIGAGGSGSSTTGSSPATTPQETQPAPQVTETMPAETLPETEAPEETSAAETEESIVEIPETIPVPETEATRETERRPEIGPGIPTEGSAPPTIPTDEPPEPGEKPTVEAVGPGV